MTGIHFALLGHPADYQHFVRLSKLQSCCLHDHRDTSIKLVGWMPSYVTNHRPIASLRGVAVEGRLIICPFFPDQIQTASEMKRAYDKVVAGCELAQQLGAKVVSLGGFTSILDGANGNALAAQLGLTITSGNSLTAALAVAQLLRVLESTGRPIQQETVAIIGATGDIDAFVLLMLSTAGQRIYLVARNRRRLEAFQQEIGTVIPVDIATESRRARGDIVIVAAAASAAPILDESDLAAGTIVCDLGYPKNLSQSPEARTDVLIFLADSPNSPNPSIWIPTLDCPRVIFSTDASAKGSCWRARPENLGLAALPRPRRRRSGKRSSGRGAPARNPTRAALSRPPAPRSSRARPFR